MMFEKLLADSLVPHKQPGHGSEFLGTGINEGRVIPQGGSTVLSLEEGTTITKHEETADQRHREF